MHDINDIYNQIDNIIYIIKMVRDCAFIYFEYVTIKKLFMWGGL